ncbi:MAG: response regulator transcription factor [Deltaproteobacteria bacterium]|jgi:DNA-binding response OmpR family regulator|nr:MAG: response regulator transcription factor [Deltaproteobacteria bacterium]
MRLLLAEDERRVRAFVARGLSEEGFQVRETGDGAEALDLLEAEQFDLLLLDWMLPRRSGLEVLRTLRGRNDVTPIIMLTARDAVSDRTLALNEGADDYVVKPFAFEELLARVRAVLRRVSGRASGILSYADLTLDPATRKVVRQGKEIRLTAREFALLTFLLEHAGEVVSRSRIVEAVWEHDFETFSNVVEVYIRYLRAKIDEPFPRKLIQTVRGVGYSLRDES